MRSCRELRSGRCRSRLTPSKAGVRTCGPFSDAVSRPQRSFRNSSRVSPACARMAATVPRGGCPRTVGDGRVAVLAGWKSG